jgi:hypothetical protein
MKALTRPFTTHPASVDETWGEHCAMAWSFGFRLLGASLACFLHGLFPFLFTTTGSRAIRELHERMVVKRHATPTRQESPAQR